MLLSLPVKDHVVMQTTIEIRAIVYKKPIPVITVQTQQKGSNKIIIKTISY